MILIAHRGLIDGPDSAFENNPKAIDLAFRKGYDCEVDVRYINGKWFLGHDDPTYEVDYEFLRQPGLWLHAKNLDALYILGAEKNRLNFFWHQEDDFTLTSQGYIWTYPGKELTRYSVQVMPEWQDKNLKNINSTCFGICSDYVERIKAIMPSDQSH